MGIKKTLFRAVLYNGLRIAANRVAKSIERSGYTGYYIRGTTGEKKPLDPSTRPSEFVFERN